MSVSVFVIDDSEIVREMLIRLLKQDPDIQISGEADTWISAIVMFDENRPDIIMMSSELGVSIPLDEAISEIKKVAPESKIVLCFNPQSVDSVVPSLEAGADQFIVKPYTRKKIFSVLRKIKERPL